MNVKPKDLAIVVAPHEFAGKTCTVLRAITAEDVPASLLARVGPMWLCEFPQPMQWHVAGPESVPRTTGAISDRRLRKIAGPDISLEVLRAAEVSS